MAAFWETHPLPTQLVSVFSPQYLPQVEALNLLTPLLSRLASAPMRQLRVLPAFSPFSLASATG